MQFRLLAVLSLTATLIATTASLAHAQPRAEVGASLASSTVAFGDDNEVPSTLGLPWGGFFGSNPGVYAAFFIGTRVAIEPQVGFLWVSFDGDAEHVLNFAGQVDYFIRGTTGSSPYVFGAAGMLDASGGDVTPTSVGVGAGYRILVGDRLTFRFDGRYTHFTGEFADSDAVTFILSIGGTFGQR